MTLLD